MKKLLAFVLVFCMISTLRTAALGAAPIAELLNEDGEVETTYYTVEELRLTGADNGKTLRLLDNITATLNEAGVPFLGVSNGGILDLNGKTLTLQIDLETINGDGAMIGIGTSGSNEATIKNGTIKMHVTENVKVNNGAIIIIGKMGYPLNLTNVELLYSSDSEAVISPIAIYGSLEQGPGDVTLENCVMDMGGPLTFEFVPYQGQNNPDKVVIVSGSYKNLVENERVEIRGTEMAAPPEGVDEYTTVITSEETTAVMVKSGRAYLYDSLQEAVDAAENFGAEPKITLVKETGEEVELETGANFTLVQSETAQFTGKFVAAETGYEVKVEGDKVSVEAVAPPKPEKPTVPEKPAHTPVRDTVTVEIGGERPQANPAEENPNTGAPVLTGVAAGAVAAAYSK